MLPPAVLDSLSGYTWCFKLQEHINSNIKPSGKESSLPQWKSKTWTSLALPGLTWVMCSSLNQSVTGKWNALMASVLVINPTPKPRNRISFFMDWEWGQGGFPKWKFRNCYQGSRVDAGRQKQHMSGTSRKQAAPTEHILCPQKPGNEIWSEEPSWNLWLCLCSTDSLKHLFYLSWKNWNQGW